MEILIENQQRKIPVTDRMDGLIKQAAEIALELEEITTPCEISFLLVDDEGIREINREHRNIDRPTDVLSFPMLDMLEGKLESETGDMDLDENLLLLGDIVISLEMAGKQAEEYGHSFERELAFLATHGIFHLLGYDHEAEAGEEKMLGRQEQVLARMGLKRQV